MPEAFAGAPVTGTGTVYTVPRDHRLRLELLSFTLTTDNTAGVHSALVRFYDASLAAYTARLWDWNEGGGNMTLYYTFGIGLRPFNCTVTTGMAIPCHLPDTVLAPDTQIQVSAVNTALATIAGDTITAIALYGTFISVVDEPSGTPLDLLTGFLPSDVPA